MFAVGICSWPADLGSSELSSDRRRWDLGVVHETWAGGDEGGGRRRLGRCNSSTIEFTGVVVGCDEGKGTVAEIVVMISPLLAPAVVDAVVPGVLKNFSFC